MSNNLIADMRVNIAGVELKNPVMTASGTFGSGREYEKYIDINQLGAVIVKGVANKEWLGNPAPRIAETYGGMLNAVGLQNPGVDVFIKEDIPFLRQFDTKIVVNVVGRTIEDYVEVAERLSHEDVDLLELNISCPNVKEGGVAFGTNPIMAETITKAVKKVAKQPLIVKLSPNVTDITEIAKAVEAGGADSISLINTLLGMRVDINKRQPIIANKVAGLSGPGIKPVAVRMVYQVHKAVKLPIIGLGGIMNYEDAVEFMMVGASAIAVGTANLINPRATIEIVEGLKKYAERQKMRDINEIVGIIE
jgi:dihydroorotate dehydrogenase (NAD+) catalytic subunit